MLKRYIEILSLPGALAFSLAGLLARFPMALVGLSGILMVESLYGNYAAAGLVSGAGTVAFAVFAPVLARLVDAFGQSRVMIPSICLSALGMTGLVFGALNHVPVPVLVAFSIVAGGASGSIGALVRARWAGITTRAWQIQAAYSLEAAFDELVFIIGPVLATLLATTVHPVAGMCLAIMLSLVGGMWFLLQKKTEPKPTPRLKGSHPGSVMANPAMIVLAVTYMGAGALFGANDLSVVAFTEERSAPALAGVMLAVFSLGSFLGALTYGASTWRIPMWRLFGFGVLAIAVGASTFVLAGSLGMLAIIMLITGLAIAPTMTNVNTIVQKIMPPTRLTEGLTWMSTAMNIGVSVGAAISGPIIDNQGSHGGFLVVIAAAWIMALAAAVGLRTLKRVIEKATSAEPAV